MAGFELSFESLSEFLAPMWVEISFMLFFSLGFALLRDGLFPRIKVKKGKAFKEERPPLPQHKQLEADVAAGHSDAAMRTWHATKSLAPTPLELLKAVVQIFLNEKPDELVEEVVGHFAAHRRELSNAKNVTAVLDVVARAGRADLLDELASACWQRLRVAPSVQTYEVLLGGHAAAGEEGRVAALLEELRGGRLAPTARAYSLTVKGFLKRGLAEAALRQIQGMHQHGFTVPSFAVAQLFRTCQKDRVAEMLDVVSKTLPLPQEALVVLLEDCLKRNDLPLALHAEKAARACGTPLTCSAYDALLKILVAHADAHTLLAFQNMQDEGVRISEGLCVGLLARCAESKFLRFAEEIARFAKGRDGMTLAVYSALMKCYAYCGMYDKACDLYSQIRAEGLEPDGVMYGCLMKFAVECGRTELSRELFNKAPTLDIQNYMSLIRAAGRDKDGARAVAVLEKLKASGVSVDIAAYNSVLDACVSAGDTKRARALMAEMRAMVRLDVVTYNTLLKGYCSQGDVQGAKALLATMRQEGLAPDDVSYNCLINTAVSSGDIQEAWSTIDMMERDGVPVDHYTLSIMMKALKRVKNPKEVGRALDLLDRSGIDICSDEILLNTVLETCTRHRQLQRLEGTVAKFTSSKLRPSVHTYGSLIKACSTLKRLDKCRELWSTMVDQCGMQPNEIVLGCMLDALVCNGDVEDAVAVLRQWKANIAPNTVMYSTIIKGFANSRQAARALDMWKEMCELGLSPNVVVYNALIDSQARVGAMDEVSKLLESMVANGFSPDAITYSTIAKGYCVKNDPDKAFEILRSMQKSGMAADSVIYNTVIDGCTRQNRMDLVDSALDDMHKYGIAPSNFTLGILVKMYGRRHQLDKAFQVVEELPRKHGLRVNMQVRTCLMSACLGNNDLDRATRVFEDMKQAEGGMDSNACGSLISSCVRRGRLDQAVQLVEDAYGLPREVSGRAGPRGLLAGQALGTEPLEQLLRALGQRQLMKSVGAPLLQRLRAARVPLSGKLLAASLPGREA